MKKFLLLLLTLPTLVSFAQQGISVKSFDVIPNDMDARVNFPKRDQNGEVCAIIKVVTTQTGFDWEPDALGITAAERKVGEYWLYVPRGAKRLTIKHDKLGILRNYQYPVPIQAATVYVMELVTGTVEVVVKEAEIETQWLAISTEPAGANVFIEERLVGTTPYTGQLPEGDYAYRIELPRYHAEAGKITLKGKRETLNFTLRPRFGNVSVSSTPESGMMVYLDDENTGKTTPTTLEGVSSGAHTVKLISQWYQPQAKSVTVNDSQTTNAQFTMEPAFANITVTTSPSASILVNGNRKGTGTHTDRMLTGIYTLKAELDKHHPEERQLVVEAGKPQTIELNLKPRTGRLNITSTPFDATITLNGKNYGTTPNTVKDVLMGDYTLTLTKAGYGTVTKTVTITEGKTTDVNETLPSGMEVTIASTPAGAQLWIDGTAAGSTPVTTTLSFDSHTLRLVNGKKEVKDQINITQGGKARWEYDVREGTEVTITSTPAGAQLWIDGVSAGSTPVTTILSFGSHSLRLVNGKKKVTDQITITQGGKNRWEYDVREFDGKNFTERVAGVIIDMVAVKGGTYTMGCTGEQGSDCFGWEKPAHRVTVGDFYMGKYEVTIDQYLQFCKETDSHWPEWLEKGSSNNIYTGSGVDKTYYSKRSMSESNTSHPITGVNWHNAVAYCQWLSRKTGKKYRLSTEAEWEYAARGGLQSRGYKYSGSNSLVAVAEYNENNDIKTKPVGGKQPNELGIYDMSGNVWEWCSDWYGSYSSQAQTNPQGPGSGSGRVLRGGSWDGIARSCRVWHRNNNSPHIRNSSIGFRVVLEP